MIVIVDDNKFEKVTLTCQIINQRTLKSCNIFQKLKNDMYYPKMKFLPPLLQSSLYQYRVLKK